MSKIQEALQKLRIGDEISQSQKHADLRESTHPQRRSENTRGADVPEAPIVDEKLPASRISISPQALHDQGFQPQDADLDLVAQEFRRIKRPILNNAFGGGLSDSVNSNVIMLASALPKTGKTFCSFNLATSIARERDIGAVLVDADVLKPNISRVLGLEKHIGLIDYLLDSSISIDDILVVTDLHGIVVVPAGRQHEMATELLASRRMGRFVKSMSERFSSRAIIVDTPPLLLTNEAHVLAEHMGQIVLVVEAGMSTQESVTEVLGSLSKTKPINAILNKARSKSFGAYGGGEYGYYSAPQRGLKNANQEK